MPPGSSLSNRSERKEKWKFNVVAKRTDILQTLFVPNIFYKLNEDTTDVMGSLYNIKV